MSIPRDVFVSHASEDHALAVQVCELLEQRGLGCWIAPRDVGAGVEWDEAILDAIEHSRAYLLLLSSNANHSSFVKNELNRAFSSSKAIVTFRIEDVQPGRSLELYLARHHWTDAFPPPLEPRVDQLATSLLALLNHTTAEATQVPAQQSAGRRRAWAWKGWMSAVTVAGLAVAAMLVPTVRHLRETPAIETRTDIDTPVTDDPRSFALSPDGKQIVFIANSDGVPRLWLRSLATATAQPLPGTEGAGFPFWSPDSHSIAFPASGALKRLDLGGGQPQTLAAVSDGTGGGSWGTDGVILFVPSNFDYLRRVAATGGAAPEVIKFDRQFGFVIAPTFLPDGRRFLFRTIRGTNDGIYLGALDGRTPVRLTADSARYAWLTSGWLLWLRAGALVAQRLDVEKAELTGKPVKVADGVNAVSASTTGLVAYRTGTAFRQRQLTWFDQTGATMGIIGEPDDTINAPRVASDGRRVAMNRGPNENNDIWILDGTRASRMTFDTSSEFFPVWSPDGTRIAFSSRRADSTDLYQKLANGEGGEELIVHSDRPKLPSSWSADGRYLLYHSLDTGGGPDLWVLPLEGDRKPYVFLKTPFDEASGQFSPDGQWVAYVSNESGRTEIYVRPFVPPGRASAQSESSGGHWQVSAAGGVQPAWRSDGKKIYYISPAGEMMAASVTLTRSGLVPDTPIRLFQTRVVGSGLQRIVPQYDVAPDGRFLINTELDAGASPPITLLQNWNPEAKK